MALAEVQVEPNIPINEIIKHEFKSVRQFWHTLAIDPNEALTTAFPIMVASIEAEQNLYTDDPTPLLPEDIFCLLNELTEYLVDPDFPCQGIELAYNPIAAFGQEGMAALVESGLRYM